MENFFSDLNEILADNFGFEPHDATIFSGAFAYIGIGVVSSILATAAIIKISKMNRRTAMPKEPQIDNLPKLKDEIKVEIGEFGKIVSEKKMMIKGQELDYFIIKKSKFEKDTLPVGTIVVVIKKNSREAYVKPADDKDAVRLKGLL